MEEKKDNNVEEKVSTLKRGKDAVIRCNSALKRIFIAIGTKLIGQDKPGWLQKITAGFLFILGALFFLLSAPTTAATIGCAVGFDKLVGEEITNKFMEKMKCAESSSESQPSSPALQPA